MGNQSGKATNLDDPALDLKTDVAADKKERVNAYSTPRNDAQSAVQTEDIRDKYELLVVLGSGSFGEVYQVRVKQFPDKVRAVKIVERDDHHQEDDESWSNSEMFRREVGLLQTLKHQNIVRFWDVYEDVHFLYVVMDLCRGGEVFDMVLKQKRFTEDNAATIGTQMLSAIAYIHSKEIMHRDIKAENFLLANDSPTSVVKMIDFGMAIKFKKGEMYSEMCGSPHYLAPELIGQRYEKAVDMWAFGVLMYLMLYGYYPFDANSTREIAIKVLTASIKWQSKSFKLSRETVAFLACCLQPKMKKRITAEDALEHPWILAAAKPDLERNRELTQDNLKEAVLSAREQASLSRKQVDPEVGQHRREKLDSINADFKKGTRIGRRLGETPAEDFMSKPEFVRRSSRLVTAPSQQVTRAGVAMIISASEAVEKAMRRRSTGSDSPATPESEPDSRREPSTIDPLDDVEVQVDLTVGAESSSPQRRTKQALTAKANMMYMEDIDETEVLRLKNLWASWHNQREAEGGHQVSLPKEHRRATTDCAVSIIRADIDEKMNISDGSDDEESSSESVGDGASSSRPGSKRRMKTTDGIVVHSKFRLGSDDAAGVYNSKKKKKKKKKEKAKVDQVMHDLLFDPAENECTRKDTEGVSLPSEPQTTSIAEQATQSILRIVSPVNAAGKASAKGTASGQGLLPTTKAAESDSTTKFDVFHEVMPVSKVAVALPGRTGDAAAGA
mmetsp:Transcript_11001/g.19619  ORF Transcript_11001/g.19619 Transcript_11001/m.19619 type:complete len:729 (+) Transcript_11001:54-2240(+)